MKPRIQTLGLLLSVSAILLGFGAWYYLERMTHLDMAFQTFLILKSGHLEIQSGRFGAAVTQIWAWTAQWMGFPLKGVLLAYSFGHVVWPVLLASLAWVWGQWRWSMVILLSLDAL
jgi:cytochrome b subunit of formate dehydrogenase